MSNNSDKPLLEEPSRFQQPTASSKGRAKPPSQPLLPKRPQQTPRPTKTVSVKPPGQMVAPTPRGAPNPKKKACSTPDNKDLTMTDLTLDASRISQLNRTRAPNEGDVSMVAPTLQMYEQQQATSNTLDKTIVKTDVRKGTKSNWKRSAQAAVKVERATSGDRTTTRTSVKTGGNRSSSGSQATQAKVVGVSPVKEEEISDEMLQVAYIRYLQSRWIAIKSKEALKKGEKEMNDQLFTIFNATEKLRQEETKVDEEKQLWDTLIRVGRSLRLVKEKLGPALDLMTRVDGELGRVAEGLDRVQHHLVVQGVSLPDQETAAAELEGLSSLLTDFNKEFDARKVELEDRAPNMKRLSTEYKQMAAGYKVCLTMLRENMAKYKQVEELAIHEASLLMSFDQLRKAEEKEMAKQEEE